MNQINLEKNNLSKIIQEFFCEYLINQRNLSSQTIASYRDSFRLLLQYTGDKMGKAPVNLTLAEIDASLVLSFLDHIESNRKNSIRSRNLRLAAIRSFMNYVAYKNPTEAAEIQQVLSIPMKHFNRPMLDFLSREEIDAIISIPDKKTWCGHRDFTMFLLFYNLGTRVSELIDIQIKDVTIQKVSFILIHGKGRKERVIPLWKNSTLHLKTWLKRLDRTTDSPLFPNRNGEKLTRSGVEYRLRETVKKATIVCPSLKRRHVTTHTIRQYVECYNM